MIFPYILQDCLILSFRVSEELLILIFSLSSVSVVNQVFMIMKTKMRQERARELRDAFNSVSPFIDKHTSLVCPGCDKVCCRDKHGRYDSDDLEFLKSLGVKISRDQPERNESDPCRYLTGRGCSLKRWMRPYRCTFFFCDPLMKSLENDSAKLYQAFVDFFQHLVSVRQEFLEY